MANAAPDDFKQEIRFAVVLYGGVSLAIYINGVVQELLRLVRATSIPFDELDPIEKVYRKLGQIVGAGNLDGEPADGGPLHARFLIDVISGTSAGGINGMFLAKALANEGSLKSLQNLWITEGALEKLLNDKPSYDDLPVSPPKETRSLLNSARMYYKLFQALEDMDGQPAPATSRLADRISLFATTTDIDGVALPIQLADMIVYERRYRNVFRFHYSPNCNDFARPLNPILAFAARCTSSFPFAFEPMTLGAIDTVLGGMPVYRNRLDECGSMATRWQQFFAQYLVPSLGFPPTNNNFSQRAFGDGGYLNNKPFSYAIDALTESESDLPVERKLFYIEPGPEHPELDKTGSQPPNAIENSLDALITIPGYQTIREDLNRAIDRNAVIARIRQAILQIEEEFDSHDCQNESELAEIAFLKEESSLRTYYRLRMSDVTDQLTTAIARAYRIEDGTALFRCLRALVHEWRVRAYESSATPDGVFDFLRKFDLPYRLRRLRFVLRKLDTYASSTSERKSAAARFAGVDRHSIDMDALKRMRAPIARNYRTLLDIRRALLSDDLPVGGPASDATAPQPEPGDALEQIRRALRLDRQRLEEVLHSIIHSDAIGEPQQGNERYESRRLRRTAKEVTSSEDLLAGGARTLFDERPELLAVLNGLGDTLAARLLPVLQAADITKLLQQSAAKPLRAFYTCFDKFDSAAFLLLYGTNAGAGDPVEIHRISPEDASVLEPDVLKRRKKLKGLAVAHFGAFLDETWRESDILWGRLDTAERIVSTLLPLDTQSAMRQALIDQAQSAIIADFDVPERTRRLAQACVAGKKPNVRLNQATQAAALQAVIAAPAVPLRAQNTAIMQNWAALLSDEMDRKLLLEDAARSSTITGRILDTIGSDENVPTGGRWLTRAGRVLWSLTELAAPRTALETASRYWMQMALLIAIILIAGGAVSGTAALTQFGWSLFGISFTLQLLWLMLRSFMSGPATHSTLRRAIIGLIVLIAAVLLALGAYEFWTLCYALIGWSSAHLAPPVRGLGKIRENVGPALLQTGSAVVGGAVIWALARITRNVDRGY